MTKYKTVASKKFLWKPLEKNQAKQIYLDATVLLVSLTLCIFPFYRGFAASEPSIRLFKPPHKQSNQFTIYDPSLLRMTQMQERFIKASTNLISVNDAIKLAIANNPSLQIAKSAIDSQYYDLLAARRQWIPTLVFANTLPTLGSYNSKSFVKYKNEPLGGVPQDYQINSKYYTFAPEIQASWTFLSVPRAGAIKSNFYGLKSEQYLYSVSLRNLILSVQQAYYQVQSAKKLIDSFTQIYLINKRQLEILDARYSKKLIDLGSLSQTKAQYYQQLSQLISAYNQYFSACAQLSNVIGEKNYQDFVPADDLKATGSWDKDLSQTIQEAIMLREEIKSNLAMANSYKWTASALYGTYYPTFTLSALGTLTIDNGNISQPSYVQSTNNYDYSLSTVSSTVGLGFTWSLFDGGVNAASAKSYQAQAKQQLLTSIQNEELVASQVKSAFYLYQTSIESVKVTKQALDAANQAQKVANIRFQIGFGDITTVVQTIQLYGQAYTSYISALLDYNTAVAQLYRYSAVYPESIEQTAEAVINQAFDNH
jgi:outer membrane protein TolC